MSNPNPTTTTTTISAELPPDTRDPPPPYVPDADSDNDSDVPPPEYTGPRRPPRTLRPPFVPHVPFPPCITAYYIYELSPATLRCLRLCDASDPSKTPLFTINLQFGRMHGPLADRRGFNLHNGPSRKDPVIAAAGDESSVDKYVALDDRSVVFIPPVRPAEDATVYHLVEEGMRHLAGGGGEAQGGVTFRWAVEVGRGRRNREVFEWRKKKIGGKGFELVRVRARPGVGSSVVENGEGFSNGDGEVVAVLSWPSGVVDTVKKAFMLEFKGTGLDGFLGDRWALMVIVTAARIWCLRWRGKTTKGYVALAETVHAK
ncbi:hypothetical protein QBC47DRAFT_300390 [Echria macrotheca]|uniref:Uncharacterized protein n=1 Tax=Echria macrotheca TaxID=438768 RepID=A0AAJ0BET9_9PEZI|nr:hypothetical protein QBC47DRAFT_300390 [Echria macrotheca]